MRPSSACIHCRRNRRRCIIDDNDVACVRCVRMKLSCSLTERVSARSQASTENVALATVTEDASLPDQALCNSLVDLYFEILHDKQHALFHRPSFIELQRQNLAPMMHVWAMMALASRFSSDPYFAGVDPWVRGNAWAANAKQSFYNRPELVSLEAVQAVCLLGIVSFCDGEMAAESLWGALAIRMVQLLDLPNNLSPDKVVRETQIRVYWTVWCSDKWSASALSLPHQLIAEHSFPRPMNEIEYEALLPGASYDSEPETFVERKRHCSTSFWNAMLPLTDILSAVMQINQSTIHKDVPRAEIHRKVEVVTATLDTWAFQLPHELRNTEENMLRLAAQGHGATLAALHIGYHHHGQVLYYQFLHRDDVLDAEYPIAIRYAARCKEHAVQLSKLLWRANHTPGCQCLWTVTGHLVAVSSSILLHTLLFEASDEEIAQAKQLLAQNFELLMHLQTLWPGVELSLNRLRAFHRACEESMTTSVSAFKWDAWMFHFLQRYMNPATDRSHATFQLSGP